MVKINSQPIDMEFMHYLGEYAIPFCIIFIKADKLKEKDLNKNLENYKAEMLETWEQMPDKDTFLETQFKNSLNDAQQAWVENNLDRYKNEVKPFLKENDFSDEAEAFAKEAIEAFDQDGEVDLENKLIYNPQIAQDYRASMSDAEEAIFNSLSILQKEGYLRAATQAYIYAESHFPKPVRNRKGDAFKHTFWNALSTVYIGETLTEQLTTAHEDINYDPNYPNHYKETQMDLHNNAQGRQIAYGAGRLYQLVQEALDGGDLRYLNNLELSGGFWKATDISQLTPTNQ